MRRLIRKKAAVLILAVLLALSAAAGCQSRKEYTYYYYDYFDTFSSLTVYAADEAAANHYDEIVREYLSRYDILLDSYEPHEGTVCLYMVNEQAGIEPVAVPDELYAFLEYGLAAFDITKGSVNIAMGALLRLWQEQLNRNADGAPTDSVAIDAAPSDAANASAETSGVAPTDATSALPDGAPAALAPTLPDTIPTLPDPAALREAALHADPANVILDPANRTVFFKDPLIRLDAGALGKGYVCARIEEALRDAGCRSALLSAGGNVLTIGTPPGLAGWNVGIRNPDPDAAEQVYTVWQVKDASVVTSGDYERYFVIGDTRYHHIIDPETLYPGTRYHSITISCRDAAAADMLSTALFLLPEADGRALAAEYDARVLYIYNDYSSG